MNIYGSPEGCSSVTFPLLLGKKIAFELIFLGSRVDVKYIKSVCYIGNDA